MFRFIEQILDGFRPCFSRRAAFRWFVVVIVGLMLRSDRLGVYESLIHFFRSTAWDAGKIRDKWYRILVSKAPLLRIHGRVVLIGDGVKQSKEGYFIPGVKKMVQESEDSSKPQYIFGHMFGAVGVLAGTLERHFCLPLKINIQEGLRSASLWDNSGISPESHIIQMIESAFETADVFGRSILLLDRYFLTTSALRKQAELNAAYGSPDHVTIVTKAKSNYVAYRKPAPKAPGAKGRPRLKGDTVKLSELLNDDSRYRKAQALLYGRRKEISYFYEDLLWGQKLYQEMRFVFVKYDGMKSIFVCTDLTIDPVRIAELYGFRFADVSLLLPDYADAEVEATVLLDTLQSEAPALTKDENERLFNEVLEDYSHITQKRERLKKLKEDAYYNALQIKYAYAVTCHKAQGGQWKNVFLDQGYMPEESLTPDYFQWLYTAFTRATGTLYLVNYPKEQIA